MVVSINSVLGSISPEDMGITLMHEHLIFGYPGWQLDIVAPGYDRQEAAKVCISKIQEVQEYGVKTIVDATPNDMTRDPELYKIVASETGVNIICSTGLYMEGKGASSYFKNRMIVTRNSQQIINEMYEIFMRDLTIGIGESGIKAGVIKICTGENEITAYEEVVMEAAILAQKDSGVPIITHTEAGTMGPEQADFLVRNGADAEKLMIGHMCGNADLSYQLNVLQKETYISFDRFGLSSHFPDSVRIESLIKLIKLGFEKRLILSHDSIMRRLGRQYPSNSPLSLNENLNLTHIFRNILPALKMAGITNEQIQTIMLDNPRHLFIGSVV